MPAAKVYLAPGVPKGADASAILFSLVETVKANEIEAQDYLKLYFSNASPQRSPRKT
jgi:transposase